jgi:hypothetical protein
VPGDYLTQALRIAMLFFTLGLGRLLDSQGIGLTGFSNTGFNYGLSIGRQYVFWRHKDVTEKFWNKAKQQSSLEGN